MPREEQNEQAIPAAQPAVNAELQDRLTLPLQSHQEWRPIVTKPGVSKKESKIAAVFLGVLVAGEAVLFLMMNGFGLPTPWSIPFVVVSILLDLKLLVLFKSGHGDPKPSLESRNKDEHPVRVWFEVNGKITGGDKGVLWFEDNAVWFNGDRSWFCIPHQELEDAADSGHPELDDMAGGLILSAGHSGQSVRVGLQTALMPWGMVDQAGSKLREELMKFRADAGASTAALGLPPLEPDPEYHGSLFQAPRSKRFEKLMTHPAFSSRLYFSVAMIVGFVMNAILGANPLTGFLAVFYVLPFSILGSIVLTTHAVGRHGKTLVANTAKDGASSAVLKALDPAVTIHDGQWAPSSETTISNLTRRKLRARHIMVGLIGIELGAAAVGLALSVSLSGLWLFAVVLDLVLYSFIRPVLQPEKDPRIASGASEDQFLVNVWIEVNGVIRGCDAGRLRIVDEALEFEGLRSRFVIAGHDLVREKFRLWHPRREIERIDRGVVVTVKSQFESLRIGFKFLKNPACKDKARPGFFREYFPLMVHGGWSNRDTVLPPTDFDEQYLLAPSPPRTEQVLLWIGFLCIPMGLFVPFHYMPWLSVVGIFIGGVSSVAWWFSGGARAMRERRRAAKALGTKWL